MLARSAWSILLSVTLRTARAQLLFPGSTEATLQQPVSWFCNQLNEELQSLPERNITLYTHAQPAGLVHASHVRISAFDALSAADHGHR